MARRWIPRVCGGVFVAGIAGLIIASIAGNNAGVVLSIGAAIALAGVVLLTFGAVTSRERIEPFDEARAALVRFDQPFKIEIMDDLAAKAAAALAAQLARGTKAATKDAEAAAKKVGDVFGKAGGTAAKLGGALSMISPEAAAAAGAINDLGDVLRRARGGAGFGVIHPLRLAERAGEIRAVRDHRGLGLPCRAGGVSQPQQVIRPDLHLWPCARPGAEYGFVIKTV